MESKREPTRTTQSSELNDQELEALVHQLIAKSREPMELEKLVEVVAQRHPSTSSSSLKRVIWRLANRGKVRFTQDWLVGAA